MKWKFWLMVGIAVLALFSAPKVVSKRRIRGSFILRQYRDANWILETKHNIAARHALGPDKDGEWKRRAHCIEVVWKTLLDAVKDSQKALELPQVRSIEELDDALEKMISDCQGKSMNGETTIWQPLKQQPS